ncbi:hypothetical protein Plhal304r1_c092g0172091 [Plasmopara halstedii]
MPVNVQVVIDGTTVQTNHVHENVNTTFKAITETDYNTYVKHGPTSNFVLDKYSTRIAEPPNDRFLPLLINKARRLHLM